MPRVQRWKKVIWKLYKDGRKDVLDGELFALAESRDVYYQLRRILLETGVATFEQRGKLKVWQFNWEVAQKHPMISEVLKLQLEEEGEGGETHEE